MKHDINELIRIYINEKATKQLLSYNKIVDKIAEEMYFSKEGEKSMVKTLRELERERINYFLTKYIKERINKLNKNLFLDTGLMSENEKIYYESYRSYIKDIIIKDPKNITEAIEHVGFYCLKDIGNVKLDDDIVELMEGDFLVAKLKDIEIYIKNNEISLV